MEDRIKVIQMFGEVVEGETYNSLKKQAGDLNSFDTLVIEIASPGGSVAEGLEIMVWFDMLSQSGKHIITVVVANAYSIASLIMLSANMKLISKHGEVMVHNPMVPELQYANANDLQQYVDSLRGLEGMMYELYQVFTGLEQEQIKSLMDNETYLSPDEAVKHGFADTVIDIKKRSFEMVVNLKNEINMSKTFNILNKVIAMVNKSDIVNQLYHTQEGSEIEIFQADPSTYKKGDRVNVDEGEIQLSDGAKLIVKGGIIEEIERSVEVAPEVAPEGETAVEEIVETPAEVPTEVIPEAVEGGDFNTGPAPVEEAPKAKDAMPAKVTEVTESVTTKETLAAPEAPVVAPIEAPVEAVVEAVIAPEVEAVEVEVEAKVEEAEAKAEAPDMTAVLDRIAKLEAKADEAEARATKAEAALINASKFEDLATEAIDGIYKSTASSFAPEAKATVEAKAQKGSIFSTAKRNAGL
jgi:ATP-dependent protease ClpP protease subunit